jgi:hypothetical protein
VTDHLREAVGEHGPRHGDGSCQRFDRPRQSRLAVELGQCLPDDRIAQAGQPADLPGRHRLDVAADGLHEHQLRHSRQDVVAPGPRQAGFAQRDVQQGAEPSARRVLTCPGQVNGLRERGQQGIEGPFVAPEETAHDPRAIGTAAAALDHQRQARCRPDEQRHVRLPPQVGRARQHVCVSLRKEDEVTFLETDRRFADGMPPARAACDEVVFDHPLGARHHDRRDFARWRRRRDPRRTQLEVEVDRPGQTHRAKHVREDVGRPAAVGCGGRASIQTGRSSRSLTHLAFWSSDSDARTWQHHHTAGSVNVPRIPRGSEERRP